MANWVTEELMLILQQINEVPYTDDRERQQLTILMSGFSKLNNKTMDKAAVKTRKEFRGWTLDEATSYSDNLDEDALKTAEELAKIRPVR